MFATTCIIAHFKPENLSKISTTTIFISNDYYPAGRV